MLLEHLLVAADQHRDVAFRGLVHSPGDGTLQHVQATLGAPLCQPQGLTSIVRAVVDPRATGRQTLENPPRATDHGIDDRR